MFIFLSIATGVVVLTTIALALWLYQSDSNNAKEYAKINKANKSIHNRLNKMSKSLDELAKNKENASEIIRFGSVLFPLRDIWYVQSYPDAEKHMVYEVVIFKENRERKFKYIAGRNANGKLLKRVQKDYDHIYRILLSFIS